MSSTDDVAKEPSFHPKIELRYIEKVTVESEETSMTTPTPGSIAVLIRETGYAYKNSPFLQSLVHLLEVNDIGEADEICCALSDKLRDSSMKTIVKGLKAILPKFGAMS